MASVRDGMKILDAHKTGTAQFVTTLQNTFLHYKVTVTKLPYTIKKQIHLLTFSVGNSKQIGHSIFKCLLFSKCFTYFKI